MSKKKEPETMLTARVPSSLVRQLDRAAQKAERSRSGEVIYRLQQSLKASRQRSAA